MSDFKEREYLKQYDWLFESRLLDVTQNNPITALMKIQHDRDLSWPITTKHGNTKIHVKFHDVRLDRIEEIIVALGNNRKMSWRGHRILGFDLCWIVGYKNSITTTHSAFTGIKSINQLVALVISIRNLLTKEISPFDEEVWKLFLEDSVEDDVNDFYDNKFVENNLTNFYALLDDPNELALLDFVFYLPGDLEAGFEPLSNQEMQDLTDPRNLYTVQDMIDVEHNYFSSVDPRELYNKRRMDYASRPIPDSALNPDLLDAYSRFMNLPRTSRESNQIANLRRNLNKYKRLRKNVFRF